MPKGLIAQVPGPRRDGSRLLVVDRLDQNFSHLHFSDLPKLLHPGDLLVVNDTRVVPAKLLGRKETGGLVEILVLEHREANEDGPSTRTCLLKASKRPRKGALLFFDSGVCGKVREVMDEGLVRITFTGDRSIDSLLEERGRMPLPPYIKREAEDGHGRLDRERYQTVFSSIRGAVAAPTAGLHFTEDLVENLNHAGISVVSLTLHVGHGTFKPVRVGDIRDHRLGEESYRIGPETAKAIEETREKGGRVVAVGTTVVRALESSCEPDGTILPGEGRTGLLVTPGYSFKAVDALITNFHLPKSSLLFLVSAFAGLDLTRSAYSVAIDREYRFYSYGDAMLII